MLLFEGTFLAFSQPGKTTLHGGQSRSWSADQREKKRRKKSVSVCVAVSHMATMLCVCFLPFSLDVPAGVTQEEGHTEFLIHLLSAVRALIFLARRIQPFLSLVDRAVEFCVLTI